MLRSPFSVRAPKAPAISGLIALAQVWTALGYLVEQWASWREAVAHRLRIGVFEARFSPILAWPASLALGALGQWSWSHQLLGRVERRGPLFSNWRRVQEDRLRRACDAASPTAGDQGPFVAIREGKVAGLVLKSPAPGEKGVLLLKNTERIDAFRRSVNMPRLLQEYRLVLEPSWSGYADPRILAFSAYRDHPVLVMATCEDDAGLLRALESNLIPLALGASDWVHPDVFRVLPGTAKRYDAILNARWTMMKRHHLLLRALRDLRDSTFRVAIVARNIPEDRQRGILLKAIERSGVARQIDIFEDLTPPQVNEVLNASKVNLLLSRQEGSNRSLFEGFFAGVPGVAFANHIGIPKDHFRAETGRLIRPETLAETLRFLRSRWGEFHPRDWAVAHISAQISTSRSRGEMDFGDCGEMQFARVRVLPNIRCGQWSPACGRSRAEVWPLRVDFPSSSRLQ
jgi:hypothetical protein